MRWRAHVTGRTNGYAVIEASLTLALVSMIFGGFILLLKASRGAQEEGASRSELQEIGRRAMSRVLEDLRGTGIVEDALGNFPVIYERPAGDESTPRGEFVASLSYTDADDVAWASYERGRDRVEVNRDAECREILFRVPRDTDGNGYPIDSTGLVEWGDQVMSYRVVQYPDGRRWLERRTDDASPEPVAPYVEKITFDCIMNDRSLLYNQIAVVIYLSREGHRGQSIEAALEGIATLRNTRQID
ncbi:MAG: hypothetical protein AB1486_22950 [Planctomycetota bacterium]